MLLLLFLSASLVVSQEADEEPHPDPNEEHYDNMVYIGRMEGDKRAPHSVDNGIKYIFGTSFDESHKEIEEADLLHEHHGTYHDLADRNYPVKTREEVLRERRHKDISQQGPRPFGYVGTYIACSAITLHVIEAHTS